MIKIEGEILESATKVGEEWSRLLESGNPWETTADLRSHLSRLSGYVRDYVRFKSLQSRHREDKQS